jgi:RNA polymerase sigma-70 factor (ECF subfamily)
VSLLEGAKAMQGLTATLERSDRALVESARHGDADAFGELVRRHYRRCVDLANYFLRNDCDAEDQVQVALLKTHMRLHQYQGEAEFATWLLRIVTNECLMFMRERRRARFLYLDDISRESESVPFELPERSPDPEHELASTELKQILETEVRRIPPLLRNVIMLRDLQELPMVAVANALQISVPAAKSRLLRARTELRVRLLRQGSVSPPSRARVPRVSHYPATNPKRDRTRF